MQKKAVKSKLKTVRMKKKKGAWTNSAVFEQMNIKTNEADVLNDTFKTWRMQ